MIRRPKTGVRVLAVTATALAAALALGGCAQPGQLGYPLPEPPAEPAPAVPDAPLGPPAQALPIDPGVPVGPGLVSSGLVDGRVSMRSSGPAQYSVATVVLAPGESTPWHRHPGTELTLVRSGEVTVQRAGSCTPVHHRAGEGVFVGDAEPHVVRNEGPVAAELVVTHLLAPGEPDDQEIEPAC